MGTRRNAPGEEHRPLIDTLVHLARRATGVPTEPLARACVEAAVRGFVLSPSGSRREIAREVIAEAAAVIVADLVQEAPPPAAPSAASSAGRKSTAAKKSAPAKRAAAAAASPKAQPAAKRRSPRA